MCCENMEFGPIKFESKDPARVPDYIDWAESHGEPGEFTFIRKQDGFYFVINRRCRYLSLVTRDCLRQDNKPRVCREYDCRSSMKKLKNGRKVE